MVVGTRDELGVGGVGRSCEDCYGVEEEVEVEERDTIEGYGRS